MSRGWIGVDLDGTLAHWEWNNRIEYNPCVVGEPIAPMIERVKLWLASGVEVRIFTARVTEDGHRDINEVRSAIQDWCELHVGQRLAVTNIKDYGLIQLWDDRAVRVVENSGNPCCKNHND